MLIFTKCINKSGISIWYIHYHVSTMFYLNFKILIVKYIERKINEQIIITILCPCDRRTDSVSLVKGSRSHIFEP